MVLEQKKREKRTKGAVDCWDDNENPHCLFCEEEASRLSLCLHEIVLPSLSTMDNVILREMDC